MLDKVACWIQIHIALTFFATYTIMHCFNIFRFDLFQALKWDLYPFTVNSWLNVFLQLVNSHWRDNAGDQAFVVPRYSQNTFIQVARVRTRTLHERLVHFVE